MIVFYVGGIVIAACFGCAGVARRMTDPKDPTGLGLMLIGILLGVMVGASVMLPGVKL